ncbi:MAG: hypothetical protein HQK96_08475 [Nitrospirae bacterium]|nr:hypothetical protein [Nitrospirota bacterium]MBF0554572.1 hypothetical protein [Nitrospirota bacterium]
MLELGGVPVPEEAHEVSLELPRQPSLVCMPVVEELQLQAVRTLVVEEVPHNMAVAPVHSKLVNSEPLVHNIHLRLILPTTIIIFSSSSLHSYLFDSIL